MSTNQSADGKTTARSFLKIALVEGTVLLAAVVLLTMDVIPFEVFIGVVAVCVAGSGIAVMRVSRQAQESAPAVKDQVSDPGAGSGSAPSSTVDRENPFTH